MYINANSTFHPMHNLFRAYFKFQYFCFTIVYNDMNSSLFEIFRICTCFQTIFSCMYEFKLFQLRLLLCSKKGTQVMLRKSHYIPEMRWHSFLVGGGLSMLKYVVLVPLQIWRQILKYMLRPYFGNRNMITTA